MPVGQTSGSVHLGDCSYCDKTDVPVVNFRPEKNYITGKICEECYDEQQERNQYRCLWCGDYVALEPHHDHDWPASRRLAAHVQRSHEDQGGWKRYKRKHEVSV